MPRAAAAKVPPKPKAPPKTIQVITEYPPFEFSGWTLEHVQSALDALGRGDLRWPECLLLALEKDPAFAHGRRTRCRTAAAMPMSLEFPEDFPLEQARELVAHLPDLWGASYVGEDGAQLGHALACGTKYRVCLGVAPAAVDWSLSATGKTWLPTLHARSAGRLRFDQNLNRYKFRTRDAEEDVIPDGKRWLLWREMSSNYPHQEALLRALAIIVWFKQATVRYWGSYNRVHGEPQKKAKVPGKQREGEDVAKLAEQLRTLIGGQVIICPQYANGESFDVTLLEALGSTWETFPAFIEYADKWITLCWLGAWDNTQGDAAGSRARAEVHDKVSQREMANDCDGTASVLRILWRQFCAYNGIDPALAPVSCFDTTTVMDREAEAKIQASMGMAAQSRGLALQAAGNAFKSMTEAKVSYDPDHILRQLGFELRPGDADRATLDDIPPPAPPA